MTAARDPLREAFYAWHKERHGYMLDGDEFLHDGGLQAQRWEAWQEATRRASAREKSLLLVAVGSEDTPHIQLVLQPGQRVFIESPNEPW